MGWNMFDLEPIDEETRWALREISAQRAPAKRKEALDRDSRCSERNLQKTSG